MFGLAAVVLFAVALLLHLIGSGHLVLTLELAGLTALALHMLGVLPWAWRKP